MYKKIYQSSRCKLFMEVGNVFSWISDEVDHFNWIGIVHPSYKAVCLWIAADKKKCIEYCLAIRPLSKYLQNWNTVFWFAKLFFSGTPHQAEGNTLPWNQRFNAGPAINRSNLNLRSIHPTTTFMGEPLEAEEAQALPTHAMIPSLSSKGTSVLTWLLHRPPLFAVLELPQPCTNPAP